MRRLAIRIANVLLFVVCCYATAGVFNQVSGQLLAPLGQAPELAISQPSQQTVRSATRVLDINRRNLFGSKVKAEALAIAPPPPEPEPELVATETKLPLTLIGTAAFPKNTELSRAAIAELGGRDPEILAIGDPLERHPGVVVAGISARQVVLDNEGIREILRLDGDEEVAPAGNFRPPKRTTGRSSRRAKRSASGGKASGRDSSSKRSSLVDSLKRLAEQTSRSAPQLDNLLSQARILPKYEDGSMVGIELSGVQGGSFYQQIGLKDGDVITELNGIKIDSPTASQEVIASLSELPEIFAIVNGRPFTVSAAQIAEYMESEAFEP